MKHLGVNVYLWGASAQNRLLVHSLGPTVREIRDVGLAQRFWFDRFDARGPHLFLLLGVLPEAFETARDHFEQRISAYLKAAPSSEVLTREQLEEHHQQTRGKILCAADALAGIAENNSFLFFEHPPDDYPFRLTTELTNPEELWLMLDSLSLWSIRRLGACANGTPTGAGVRWAAALDLALREAGVAAEYWRYHATTLISGLGGRLAAEEPQVLDSLEPAVGAKNAQVFSRIWSEAEIGAPQLFPMSRLIEVALTGLPADHRYRVLREVVHCTWKQLGIPVLQHIPLVLFAWSRNLRP